MHICRASAAVACFIAAAMPMWGAGNGLRGDYFNNTGLLGSTVVSRTDTTVNFTWSGAPATGMSTDNFSVRWSGKLEAPVTGAYTLAMTSGDGARVWLNGALVIDHWTAHETAVKDTSAAINLTASQQYDLKIEFYDRTGTATAKLTWSYPGQTEIVVPQARLYSDAATVMATPTYMSSMTPTSATSGNGPYERDLSSGGTEAGDGSTITMGGVKWSRGLGVSASSELVYALNGQYQTFLADIGVDDDVNDRGSVVFEVWLDGTRKYQSAVIKGYHKSTSISVPVTGGNQLKLVVTDGGDGNAYDHADWAGARVLNQTMSTPTDGGSTPATLPAPTGFAATAGDTKVALKWNMVTGAIGYRLYRSTASGQQGAQLGGILTSLTYNDISVANGATYFYTVFAVNTTGPGAASAQISAKPLPPAPPAPTGLAATAGNTQVTLNWTGSASATSYNLYRATSSGGQGTVPVQTGITGTTFTDIGLTNGTVYYYKVAAVGDGGTSGMSNQASAKPTLPALPSAPTGFAANAGNTQITLSWNSVNGATSYNLFRATTSGGQGDTPVQTGISGVTFVDTGLTNGTTYYYKIAAVNVTGQGSKSSQVSAAPFPDAITLSAEQKSAFKFLRQSTWGPTMPMVDHVVQVGKSAFLDEQFALPATPYPDALVTMPNMELVGEQFFQNGMQGQDQLRQRVAWALSQIWVASAIKVDNTHAMVPYIRILEDGAFGNVRDVLEQVTLTPAMGEFLDMVNNKKANTTTGTMPNENYARELMQLFTIGLTDLNDDGSTTGTPTYGQPDILDMARVLTGWTYGDAVAGDPTRINSAYYDGPMEPVDRYHDTGSKTVLGAAFPAGQNARADLKQALDLLFNHKNMPAFFSKEMIQRLVKSNPSPAYISAVAAAFKDNGQGVRGDMKAILRAILLHPEAAQTPDSGKFSEPALFMLTFARELNSTVVDHPFFTDFSQDMGQQIWYAPSVFNYFSPGYRLNGVPGPELQIWSTATAMTRTNWIASLVSGGFGNDFKIDTTPYLPYVGNNAALVDTANSLLMGGTMGPEMRGAILTALPSSTSNTDRIRTVLYLIGTSMQYQVER